MIFQYYLWKKPIDYANDDSIEQLLNMSSSLESK